VPIKWLIYGAVIVAAAGVWLWRERQKPKDDEPASIVILLRNPKTLDVQILAGLLSKVTGRSVRAVEVGKSGTPDHDNKPAGEMVAGASPHFIAQVGGTAFVIHNLSQPYMDDPVQASETFQELRLRKAIREHLANLIDSDCLAPLPPTPQPIRSMQLGGDAGKTAL
jgi:hypothetical protein